MERIGGERAGETQSIRQVVVACFIGTFIEWYEFFLYGTLASLVFGQLFFPSGDPLLGALVDFSEGVVFITPLLGGLIFGYYGGRIGRKPMLVISLMMMGIATFTIGLLPTFESIGIWAAVLLIVLRIFQSLSVGGEWSGAVLMAVEHSPEGRRGFYGGWLQTGVVAGFVLANATLLPLTWILSQEQFLAWGWRIPYLASIGLVGVGLFMRLKITETPVFRQESQTEVRVRILDVVRYYPKTVLLTVGMRIGESAIFYILTIFSLVYVVIVLEVPRDTAVWGVFIGAIISLVSVPAFGALSDRFGRRTVYMSGAVFSMLFSFPFFWLLDTATPVLIWLAIVLGVVLAHGPMYGPQAAYFCELFGTRLRYSGASIGYQLGSVVGAGFSPIIATSLLALAGGRPWLIAVYMIVLSLITVGSTYLASETYREDITEERLRFDQRAGAERSERRTLRLAAVLVFLCSLVLVLVLGSWQIALPFYSAIVAFLGFVSLVKGRNQVASWTLIVVGLLVAIVALIELFVTHN